MRGMVWVIDNLVSLVQEFATVATSDPLSAVLLALGAVLTAFASLFFGFLVAGGLLDFLTPDVGGRSTRRGH